MRALVAPGVWILMMMCADGGAQEPAARMVVVAPEALGDFNGTDQKPILEAMKALGEGGGTVHIKRGTYLIRSELRPTAGVTFAGEQGTVLRLPSPVLVTTGAGQGATRLTVADASELAAETVVQVCPPAGQETFADREEKSLKVTVAAIEGQTLVLEVALPFPVQEGSRVGYSHHVIRVSSPQSNVTVRDLTIDGGRVPDVPMPGHADRCAIWASGPYSYEGGPTGPPVEGLKVINCHIRDCYGRAVAMYSVVKSDVRGCLIERIADEAIDFDHFCTHCTAVGNQVQDAVTGVTINDGSYCTVEYNRFTDCGTGVTVWWWHMCPQEGLNVENIIRHNFILGPRGRAISLGGHCHRNEATANFIQGQIAVEEPDNVVERNMVIE